jgi:hypothetical protein
MSKKGEHPLGNGKVAAPMQALAALTRMAINPPPRDEDLYAASTGPRPVAVPALTPDFFTRTAAQNKR